jgi:hypothetical protein
MTGCPLCFALADRESAYQKFGWAEHDTHLPAAADRLVVVRDLRPYSSRALQLRQCPQCATFYLYQSDYEYLVNGCEDEEHLTRLTPAEARGYLT